jgi:GntR family transcriptional regulator / MocR family aminotransferase
VHRNPSREVLGYGDPQGYFPLRKAIAAHLRSARGVNCTPEQVIITSGAQQALDLAARIFLSEKDSVLIEDPCYQEARSAFAAVGAKIIPVPVDTEGLNLAAAKQKAKLIYVTPSHQYPLGVTMSLPRRLALLEWARGQTTHGSSKMITTVNFATRVARSLLCKASIKAAA